MLLPTPVPTPELQHYPLIDLNNQERRRQPWTKRHASVEQSRRMTLLYEENIYPSTEARRALADEIGMNLHSLTIWFQNKRRLSK